MQSLYPQFLHPQIFNSDACVTFLFADLARKPSLWFLTSLCAMPWDKMHLAIGKGNCSFEVRGAGTLNAHPMHKMLQVCWHRAQRMKQKEGVAQGRNGVAMVALVWHQSAQVSHIISQLLAISGGMIRRVSKILKTDCRKLSLF